MIKIKIGTLITPERYERLEDELRDFFERLGIEATIDNSVTGNRTKTR